MDSWWESLERAFGAWTQAIDEADLTWKYRQVESGEWNLLDADPGPLDGDRRLDQPLPWDHLDTGIDKQWLKDDLKRALEAATVPDCSFDGCSHCGVCSVDFGHNVVIEPPPIPTFAGGFVPNQNRAQRLRVIFGKQGDVALISHLDLLRLFDRVLRRASIPIAFSGGFHPGPRISPASALALGATSSGEIVDFELTERLDPAVFKERLVDHLPADIPVYDVTEIDLKAPAATQAVAAAHYRLTLHCDAPSIRLKDWSDWIAAVLAAPDIQFTQTTKKGTLKHVNLRDRLLDLSLSTESPEGASALPAGTVPVDYQGQCRNDGTLLRPEHLVFMLESVSGQAIQLQHIHRCALHLDPPYSSTEHHSVLK